MPLKIIRNDITKLECDAIVNAANPTLLGGGGVDGAIHKAAGRELLFACAKLGGCKVGQAKLTGAYRLPCRYIIHTVGPKWRGGCYGEKEHLESCYKESLQLALEYKCQSIAFPLISSGVYGYPKELALRVAIDMLSGFLLEHDMLVYLVIYDKAAYQISEKLFTDITSYIDDKYVEERFDATFVQQNRRYISDFGQYDEALTDPDRQRNPYFGESSILPVGAFEEENIARKYALNASKAAPKQTEIAEESEEDKLSEAAGKADSHEQSAIGRAVIYPQKAHSIKQTKGSGKTTGQWAGESPYKTTALWQTASLEDTQELKLDELISRIDESFSQMLLRKIDESGMTDAECYKKANIDRKLFSKIRNDIHYKPSKTTAIAFAIALELSLAETKDLLMKAGYALSHSNKFDIIIEYFISKKNYNVFEINEALFAFDQSLLGV